MLCQTKSPAMQYTVWGKNLFSGETPRKTRGKRASPNSFLVIAFQILAVVIKQLDSAAGPWYLVLNSDLFLQECT